MAAASHRRCGRRHGLDGEGPVGVGLRALRRRGPLTADDPRDDDLPEARLVWAGRRCRDLRRPSRTWAPGWDPRLRVVDVVLPRCGRVRRAAFEPGQLADRRAHGTAGQGRPRPGARRAASRSASRAAAASSQGSSPAAVSMVFSWPLPGEQHRVARSGSAHRLGDGLGSIGDEQQVLAASLPGRLGTPPDALEDGLAVLASGVLVGDDHQPAALARDTAHGLALAGVAVAGRAEDGDEADRRLRSGPARRGPWPATRRCGRSR